MNLEEELSILTDNTTTVETTAQPVVNEQVQAQAQVVQPTQTAMVQPAVNPQPINQPAMVNPNAAQNMVSQFDIPSLDFDINKREILERNPIYSKNEINSINTLLEKAKSYLTHD